MEYIFGLDTQEMLYGGLKLALKQCLSCGFTMLAESNHCPECGRLQNDELILIIRKGNSVQIFKMEITDKDMKKHIVGAIEVNGIVYHFGDEDTIQATQEGL